VIIMAAPNNNHPDCLLVSRRRVLQGALIGAGALALASSPIATRIAMASDPNYDGDVLVIVSLRGGFDGLNAIVPAGDPDYLRLRPNIGVPSSQLLELDGMFGLHPALAPLRPYWNDGTFGAIHAVGQTAATRSHFEATDEMDRAAPNSHLRTGWLDRALGLRSMGPVFQAIQLGDSLPSGAFAGPSPELALGSISDFHLWGMGPDDDAAWAASELRRWSKAINSMYEGAPEALAKPARTAIGAVKTTTNLSGASYTPSANYPDTDLAKALKDVARLIKADVGVQVVCVDFDNWDMHEGMGQFDEPTSWMVRQLTELGGALAAFAGDMGNRMNKTTVLTMSEFGRRVQENGSGGVDHGHGNAMLMLGGNVRGGQVHGTWPGLREQDLDDGDLAGTTDYRVILGEVLRKRCGQTGLSAVFPSADLSHELNVVKTG
jgi:uncharacterized protein (DUF1501 family)